MATYQEPNIGDWYINGDGQFIRAWGTVYQQGQLGGVIVQQLNGKCRLVTLANWQKLDLVHYPLAEQQCNELRLP